jgi:hypothetical protein
MNDSHYDNFGILIISRNLAESETFGFKASGPIYRYPKNRAAPNYWG